jgi:replicative DNA helicase
MAQMARRMAKDGVTVGVVTIESSETELVVRMLGAEAGIDGRDIQTGMLTQSHLTDIRDASARLIEGEILIHDQPSIRLAQLQAVIRKMARDGAKVVYVDYLQIVRVPGKDKRSEEVGEVSTALKAVARELNICIVAMAQLGRDSDDRRPNMGDVQHSSQVEQDADQLWLIWHKHDGDGVVTESRIILAKVRDGQVKDIRVKFNRPTLTFYEIAAGEKP